MWEVLAHYLEQPDNRLNFAFGVLGVVGTVVTVIGTYFGIRAWQASKQQADVYSYLFKVAERNINKDVTEEELAAKQEAIKRSTEKINSLQRQIKEQIPVEARRAVLHDRIQTQLELIAQSWSSIQEMRREIGNLGQKVDIPDEIVQFVQREVSPEYLRREAREHLKTYLTMSTTATALVASLVPYPLNRLIGLPLVILSVVLLGLLLWHYIRDKRSRIYKSISDTLRLTVPWTIMGAGAVFLFISIIAFVVSTNDAIGREEEIIAGSIFAALAILCGWAGYGLRSKWMRRTPADAAGVEAFEADQGRPRRS